MTASFRYRKLGYVALNVTELERSAAFYADVVGLTPSGGEAAGPRFFRCGEDHHDVVLYAAASPGIKRIGWELQDADELARAYAYFNQAGFKPVKLDEREAAALHQGESFRVREPGSGVTFEYYNSMMSMATPYRSPHTKILRLGHVVVGVEDFAGTFASLTQRMGFVLSDMVHDRLAFFRCFPNPLHHSFAIGKSDKNRLSHVNFMVTDIDDIGCAYHRLQKAGVKIVYGPGRHPPSDSIFLYYLDPDGLTLEYSFGMEEFAETTPRKPRVLEFTPLAIDSWGARPAPEFGAVGTIEPPL